MNKELKQIAELEQQIAELKQTLQDKKKWTPSGGDCFIRGGGNVHTTSKSSEQFRLHGIEFATEHEALKASDAYKLMHWQYRLAVELNEGWEPDWDNADERKYQASYSHTLTKYQIGYTYVDETTGATYFKDDSTAHKAITIMENWDI